MMAEIGIRCDGTVTCGKAGREYGADGESNPIHFTRLVKFRTFPRGLLAVRSVCALKTKKRCWDTVVKTKKTAWTESRNAIPANQQQGACFSQSQNRRKGR